MDPIEDLYQRLYGQPLRPTAAPSAQQRQIQPLTPPEENSMLGEIAGKALGGLGYVGGVLEKTFGGRAVRGILGGKPRELLSVIPGSDTFGITNEEDRVSGKELLGHDPHDDSWEATLGGLGAELALDPSMYLTFGAGAVGKAGNVAKAVGVLPKNAAGRVSQTLADVLPSVVAHGPPHPLLAAAENAAGGASKLAGMMHEPLGGLVGVGLPWGKPLATFGGKGALDAMSGAASAVDKGLRVIPGYGHAADLVGQGLDAAGRYGRALFHAPALGITERGGQEAAMEAHAGMGPIMAEYRKRAAGYGQELGALTGVDRDATGEILRGYVEGTYKGPVHPTVAAVGDKLKGDMAEIRNLAQSKGIDLNALNDNGLGYLPRYHTPPVGAPGGYRPPQQPMLATDPTVMSRQDILKGFTEGGAGVNKLALDEPLYKMIEANQPLLVAPHIAENYLGMTGAMQQRLQALQQIPPSAFDVTAHASGTPGWQQALALRNERDALQATMKQGADLVSFTRNLPPQYRASIGTPEPLRYFPNHPLNDLHEYYQRMGRLISAGETSQNYLARTAGDVAGPGTRSMIQALEDVQLKGPQAQAAALDLLNKTRVEKGMSPLAIGDLGTQHVPQETIDQISRYMRGFTHPEAVNDILSKYDAVTALTKAWQTAPWPAFHVRNFLSGMWQNYIEGGSKALTEVPNTYRMLAGQTHPDAHLIPMFAARGLTPEQATKELSALQYAWGIGGHAPHIGREATSASGELVNLGADLSGFMSRLPGEEAQTIAGAAKSYLPTSLEALDPRNVAGFRGNKDVNSFVKSGREMGNVVEGVNRGSLFTSLLREGWTPEAAAKRVLGSHFDYSPGAKTAFERSVVNRLIPFATFSKGNIPYQIEQMLQHPGGPTATLAHVAQDLRQQGGFLPDYLGSGLAVPVGSEDEAGTQRYLSRLDLPPEQAFEMLHGGPKGVQNSLLSAFSQLNPLIKAPLEYATGKQFFTGRDIGDLYSMTGSSAIDQALSNSPASRATTTLRTLMDERKWQSPDAALAIPLNLLTGAKVTDVDMAKQRSIAEREYLTELLRGQPEVGSFTTVYPKVPLEQLTPEQLQLLRLNRTVEQRAQEAAKQKKIRVQ